MKLATFLTATALLAEGVFSPAVAQALDERIMYICMEENRGLSPALRADTCLCVVKRSSTIRSRVQHLFAREGDAHRADTNECASEAVDRSAGKR